MAKPNKVQFSAKKSPLLPARADDVDPEPDAIATPPPGDPQPDAARPPAAPRGGQAELPDVGAARAARAPGAEARTAARPSGRQVEAPAGVVAVEPDPDPPPRRKRAAAKARAGTRRSDPHPAAAPQPARSATRRVQTSISLLPTGWDGLDALARDAGVSVRDLLAAVLATAMPDTPAAALAMIEQLLKSTGPDDGLHEERSYRLPLDLRTRLDSTAKALGAGPRQRSLLARAILARATPDGADEARALVTEVRLSAMRAALTASSTG